MSARPIIRMIFLLVSSGFVLFAASSLAGEIELFDGTVLKGGYPIFLSTVGPKVPRPAPDKSLNLAIVSLAESNAVRFYVPRLQAKLPNRDADLLQPEMFKLPEIKRPKSKVIDQVAGQLEATAWNEFGHRSVKFKSGDKTLALMQQIVELRPKYATVSAMDYIWEFSIPTNSIPPETLDQMLLKAIKRENADEHFAIARFYLEGDFYQLAQQKLESIRAEFPNRAKDVDLLITQLRQYLADQALRILEERREAGQHQFAYDTAKKFLALNIPEIQETTLLKLKRGVQRVDDERMKMEDVRQLLGQLQAALPADQAAEVAPLRLEIAEGLHAENLDRLAPFVDLAEAENRQPGEKLALALTGWILGPDRADTDLKVAIRLWQARGLLLEYFRAENAADRASAAEKLLAVESVGPQQILRLIPLLPPALETPGATPGEAFTVEVERRNKDRKSVV